MPEQLEHVERDAYWLADLSFAQKIEDSTHASASQDERGKMMKTLKAFLVGLVAAATLATFTSPAFAVTAGEANAVRQAHEYLHVSAFSRTGLIQQLKYSGFSTKSAKYGATHCGANWDRQAAKSARQYLKVSGFSYRGLVSQLEYSGFTPSQAKYGAHAAGLG